MSESTILFEDRDGVGLITLNRPSALNALNSALVAELDALTDEAFSVALARARRAASARRTPAPGVAPP